MKHSYVPEKHKAIILVSSIHDNKMHTETAKPPKKKFLMAIWPKEVLIPVTKRCETFNVSKIKTVGFCNIL